MSFKEDIDYSNADLATFQRWFWFLTYASPKTQEIIEVVTTYVVMSLAAKKHWKQCICDFIKDVHT